MKRIMSLFLILFFLPLVAYSEPKLEGTATELTRYLADIPETVSLSTTVTETISAQQAVVIILVSTKAAKLSDALRSNRSVRKHVLKQLKSFGIGQESVGESKFSSTPEYGFFDETPKAYSVDNTLEIGVVSEDQLINIAAIADNNNNVRYLSTKTRASDLDGIEKQLRDKALEKIKEKALAYGNSLSLALKPIGFSESNYSQVQNNGQVVNRKNRLGSYSSLVVDTKSFGKEEYSYTVVVDYRVVKK